MEVHKDTDQFFYFMDGKGKCIVNGNEYEVCDGSAVFVPAGAHHNVINTMKNHDLKLFTTYSPPEHQDGIVRKTKAEANDPTNAESFNGKTTEEDLRFPSKKSGYFTKPVKNIKNRIFICHK